MKYLYRVRKQQNMVPKLLGVLLQIYGNHCQKILNLPSQYLYSKILAKLGLELKAIANGTLSDLLYT